MTSLVYHKNDSYGLTFFSSPFRLFFVSVLDVCVRLVLRLMSFPTGVFSVFCLSFCLHICGCNCLVRLFDGFEDHLKFQWSFYEFVFKRFFVVNSCCKRVSVDFSGIMLLNSHFLSISTSLFQYSSSVSLSSCWMLKNCARLWNKFLAGMNVFFNSFSSSGRSMSFSSLPHWPLSISCLALNLVPK